MKKLMFGLAIAAVGSAFAVESSNIVGYQNTTTRTGFNYICPSFRSINGDATKIQLNDIQLDASVATGASNLQLLNKDGGMAVLYTWINKTSKSTTAKKYKELTWPEGEALDKINGIWAISSGTGVNQKYVDPAGTAEQPTEIAIGQGVQVYAVADKTVLLSGAVGEETVADLTRTARTGFNYFGNPFPTAISLNNIQMDSSVATGAANLQILNKDGGMAVLYTWINKSSKSTTAKKYKELTWPEDLDSINGIWAISSGTGVNQKYVDPAGTAEQPSTIDAGLCIQIYATEGKTYWVLCPYDL